MQDTQPPTEFSFLRSRLLAGPPNFAWTLALATAFVVAPTLVRLAVDGVIAGTTFSTYYPFVLMAAVVIGWRGGIGVALISALVANYLFMEPRYQLFANSGDFIGVLFFMLSCLMMVALVHALRRTLLDMESGREREAALNSQMKHLNGELQHRVRNTLTVVQGLAMHTFKADPAFEEPLRAFRSRLQALAEANGVLSGGQWKRCSMPDLAERALAPFNAHGALYLHGGDYDLPKEACTPLVLALHELGTNAVKYGALSTLDGSVEVEWEMQPTEDGKQALVLNWTESGGPPVATPTRRGLGSRLISAQRGINEARMDFRPEGLACRLVVAGAAG